MGHNADKLDQIKKLLNCTDCSGTLVEDAALANCGHTFCQGCLKKLKTCPVCDFKFTRRNVHHQRGDLPQLFGMLEAVILNYKMESTIPDSPPDRLLNVGHDAFDDLKNRLSSPSDPYRFISSQATYPKKRAKSNKTYGNQKKKKANFQNPIEKLLAASSSSRKYTLQNIGKADDADAVMSGTDPEIFVTSVQDTPATSVAEVDSELEFLIYQSQQQEEQGGDNMVVDSIQGKVVEYDGRSPLSPEKMPLDDGTMNIDQQLGGVDGNRNTGPYSDQMKKSANKILDVDIDNFSLSQNGSGSSQMFESNKPSCEESQGEGDKRITLENESIHILPQEIINGENDNGHEKVEKRVDPTTEVLADKRGVGPRFIEVNIVLDLSVKFQITKRGSLLTGNVSGNDESRIVSGNGHGLDNTLQANMVFSKEQLHAALQINECDDFPDPQLEQVMQVEPAKLNSARIKRILYVDSSEKQEHPPKKQKSNHENITDFSTSESKILQKGGDISDLPSAKSEKLSKGSEPSVEPIFQEAAACASKVFDSVSHNKNITLIHTECGFGSQNPKTSAQLENIPMTFEDRATVSRNESSLEAERNSSSAVPTSSAFSKPSIDTERPDSTTNRKFVFCPTRLSRTELGMLNKLSAICGGRIDRNYSDEVTHLVINLERGRVPQTMKYMFAIAGQKWIIVFDWVEECLKKGQIIDETLFETSNFPKCDIGGRKSRLAHSLLFKDFNFHIAGHMKTTGTSREDCKKLLLQLGGKIIETLDGNQEKCLLIVGDPLDAGANYQRWFDSYGWLTITWEWLLDCILSYELVPFSPSHLMTNVDGKKLLQGRLPAALLKAHEVNEV